MTIKVYTHYHSDVVHSMKLNVLFNGKKINAIPLACVSEVQLPETAKEGDVLEFKSFYFRAKVAIKPQLTNYFVYWDVPSDQMRKQLKLMFTNCLKVIAVDEVTFAEPQKYFKSEKPSKVAPNQFVNIVGLIVSIFFIAASVLFTASSETWRDFAMIFGVSGAFRFGSFVLSKEIYKSSGFQSALIFSIIGIVLVLSHDSIPVAYVILALAIFLSILAKAHMYYIKGSDIAY